MQRLVLPCHAVAFKPSLLYANLQTEATTAECVFGAFVAAGCVAY